MYTSTCAFFGACFPGAGVWETTSPACALSLTVVRRRISRSPEWLSVESACGIRRPTTFGTDAAAEAFGPAETFIVTCEPRGADCPLDGDWATTVPSGWSFGTYAT